MYISVGGVENRVGGVLEREQAVRWGPHQGRLGDAEYPEQVRGQVQDVIIKFKK